MSVLLTRTSVVPTWFVVVALVALSSPLPETRALIVPAGLVAALLVISAVIINVALRRRPNAWWVLGVTRLWHRTQLDRAAPVVNADAQDLARMDSDKG
jgi:hypothetical protein